MFEWGVNDRQFYIRDAQTDADYRGVEEVQREVWQCSDLDIVGSLMLVASQHAGAVLLCAFEGEEMIGFTYGFPAFEHGQVSIHSHMAAVRDNWRGREFQVGFYLKLAQRQAALDRQVDRITWTFDPLQSLNAYFNFVKLGVTCNRYFVNFYGDSSTSPLHQGIGTDRLWVDWFLASDRVAGRIRGDLTSRRQAAFTADETAPRLVALENGEPRLTSDLPERLSGSECLIEIPHDINGLKGRDAGLARAWREASRAAFLASLEAGFTATDFLKLNTESTPRWFYQLARQLDS